MVLFLVMAGKMYDSAYLSRKTRPYYLAENAKWILSVDEQDTYVIEPHSVVELNGSFTFEANESNVVTTCV